MNKVAKRALKILENHRGILELDEELKLELISMTEQISVKNLEYVDFIARKYAFADGIRESNHIPKKYTRHNRSVNVKGIPKHYKQKFRRAKK